jgi:quercetin dioxygenase-like cupin family protein
VKQAREIIRVGQIEIGFLLESKDTNGHLAMFEFAISPGAKVPVPHYHERYDETIYGLEGVTTATFNGQPVHLAPGQSLFIPRGAVHGFNNLQQSTAKALAVVTPALIGPEFFREAATIVNVGGPPDLEKIKAIMARHGLVPAPSPPAARQDLN